jgi:hypothetical protein
MAGTSRALAIVKPGAAQSSDGPGIDTSSSSSQFKKPVVAGNAHAHAHAPGAHRSSLTPITPTLMLISASQCY